MRLPKRQIGSWAEEIVNQCTSDRKERLQCGAVMRNIYFTGDPDGNPQTYPKTYAFIDNLASYLYSPVETRAALEKDGQSDSSTRAKASAAAALLNRYVRRSGLDTKIETAVNWSLVKGKTFIKLLWQGGTFKPYLIQPELMGVLRPDLDTLDDQEAFVHTTYITMEDFNRMIRGNPKETELRRRVKSYASPGKGNDDYEANNALKQIILGGLNPYQQSSQGPSKNRGQVNWMDGPRPQFDAKVMANLVRLDELWVWDDAYDDWTTIQMAGPDCVIEGNGDVRRNLYAAAANNPKVRDPNSPLFAKHPFHEICVNPIDGYFWGRSELQNVILLQRSLNQRIDGINLMLRKQEKPSRVIIGATSVNQKAISNLNKPDGWLCDSSPTTKIETIAQAVPDDIWHSVAEIERWFDEMAGTPPVLQGKGESGVRAQGHAETLTRNASPRFKDRALLAERAVEGIFGGALDLMKVEYGEKVTCYAPKDSLAAEILSALNKGDMSAMLEAPAMNMEQIQFLFSQLDDDMRAVVDGHSSSPAFMYETRQLMFDLAKVGGVTPKYLLEHVGLPAAQGAISDLEMRQAQEAELLKQHPELLAQHKGGGHKK